MLSRIALGLGCEKLAPEAAASTERNTTEVRKLRLPGLMSKHSFCEALCVS
jgi:hypothetical protein